ncbi:unnamed protein product [Rotaria socialis]|uniref:L-type lectin-like domain-containing protein n=1 Tax=Rotaria socialis TaxID=392032 RepID=A0A817S7T8_9BILA|nr:unnamed protein product [Rotaria socialis]CAF3379638.1 unnamed protein product [Rotaria socialis]CAF3451265.1 unnamed protein product [Rotaria socialis]CAF4107652.1 unnamed protein product [Rotaria socialis]CAF4204356.1 unnamed protein product [Rotaria socialis]
MYSKLIAALFLILSIHLTFEQDTGNNPGSYEIREHSLNRPYPSVFSTSNSYWHLIGNTLVTDRHIRLTSDSQSKVGGLWNIIPVSYPDWEMHVHFKVHGSGKELFGDGFAIWYARDPKLGGPVFGYQDYFHGLAIIMDTYSNHNGPHNHAHPYISAMINNGSLHYDHDRDGTHTSLAGCEAQFRGRDTDTLVAIRYQNDRLTVSTDIEGKNIWKECFAVSDVRLPTHYYFGFSAATGDLSDNHDIISVHTYQLETSEQRRTENRQNIIPNAPSAEPERPHTDDPKGSGWSALKIFFLIMFLILVCLAVGIGAYYYFDRRQYQRKRFY